MEEIKKMLADIARLLKEQSENTKEILNVEEASRYLSLSKSYLYKLAERKELPFFCPAGKKYYFRREDLYQYLTRFRTSSQSEIVAQANAIMSRKRPVR